MNYKRIILFGAILMFAGAASAFAVCGVYFKTTKTQYLSSPIALGAYQDIDGDGKTDYIGLPTYYVDTPGPNSLIFYKRTANGFDLPPVISSLGASFTTYGINFADVNGDGKIDMVNTNATSPRSTTLYLGDGAGGFTASTMSVINDDGEEIVSLADLNGDGKADIVSRSGAGIKYRLVQVDNSFGAPVTVGAGYTDTAAADFNGDGKTDILLWDTHSSGNFKPLINMGSAIFNAGGTVTFNSSQAFPRVIADLNNDGKPDILTNIYPDPFNNGQNVYSVFINNGSGSFTKTTTTIDIAGGNYEYASSAGDVDNDGDRDIMFMGRFDYFVGTNNGSGAFTLKKYSPPATRGGLEDFDADGKADNISFNSSVLNPSSVSVVKFKKNVCDPVGQNDFIDFDKDGESNLAYWRAADGRWTVRAVNGTENNVFWGASGDIPVPQDYDGDGQTDFAVYRPSTGVWYIFRSSDSQVFIMQFGAAGDKPVAADFDGDDKADLAVYRPSTGVWYEFRSATNSVSVANFGLSGDVPLPMDYDGDNQADLAVYRPSTGVWYILKSADSSYFISAFGASTDKPVPADYDNDGIADVAVFRDGVWYIQRVRDAAVFVRQYGSAGDIPIPSYRTVYLGTNFTIFRPGNGFVFDQGEASISMPGFNGNRIVSYILPID